MRFDDAEQYQNGKNEKTRNLTLIRNLTDRKIEFSPAQIRLNSK